MATPASAGGIGDFLSPAFGTNCANHNTGAHADGLTHHGTGTAGGNLAGIPVGSAVNQCGGADLPGVQYSTFLGQDPGAPLKLAFQPSVFIHKSARGDLSLDSKTVQHILQIDKAFS
ncbi:hypothetical protein GCM10010394_47010 [Streptomyces crystallinus]|uniref:Uncharacterized protein n=1 Tax=Streptomyces crystallinus TaxID=68191 RepID=A0ABN1GHR2_9ACTN